MGSAGAKRRAARSRWAPGQIADGGFEDGATRREPGAVALAPACAPRFGWRTRLARPAASGGGTPGAPIEAGGHSGRTRQSDDLRHARIPQPRRRRPAPKRRRKASGPPTAVAQPPPCPVPPPSPARPGPRDQRPWIGWQANRIRPAQHPEWRQRLLTRPASTSRPCPVHRLRRGARNTRRRPIPDHPGPPCGRWPRATRRRPRRAKTPPDRRAGTNVPRPDNRVMGVGARLNAGELRVARFRRGQSALASWPGRRSGHRPLRAPCAAGFPATDPALVRMALRGPPRNPAGSPGDAGRVPRTCPAPRRRRPP